MPERSAVTQARLRRLGEVLQDAKEESGKTLTQLQEDTGIDLNSINDVLLGRVNARIDTVIRVIRALGVDPGPLFRELVDLGSDDQAEGR